MIAGAGPAKAEQWARDMVANFARDPKGGDTDQLKALASGECRVAIANTYYYVGLAKSAKPDERAIAEKVGVVFPNQPPGTHVNVSGAGVLKNAPHREAAMNLSNTWRATRRSPCCSFADGNNEYPAVASIKANPALQSLGAFKRDSLNITLLGRNQAAAQQVYDRAGWK